MSKLRYLFYSFFAVFLTLVSSPVFAANLDLSKVSIDTTPVFQLAGVIITAIASIWAIKKVIKLGNRS